MEADPRDPCKGSKGVVRAVGEQVEADRLQLLLDCVLLRNVRHHVRHVPVLVAPQQVDLPLEQRSKYREYATYDQRV